MAAEAGRTVRTRRPRTASETGEERPILEAGMGLGRNHLASYAFGRDFELEDMLRMSVCWIPNEYVTMGSEPFMQKYCWA